VIVKRLKPLLVGWTRITNYSRRHRLTSASSRVSWR